MIRQNEIPTAGPVCGIKKIKCQHGKWCEDGGGFEWRGRVGEEFSRQYVWGNVKRVGGGVETR